MNKVLLYGNLGRDPETKKINENMLTKFSLATNKTYTNKAGEKITETQWHNIVLWGKLAETASKYVKKGSSIIIEGEISYRNWVDKQGVTKYITEIIGNALHLTGQPEEKKDNKIEVKAMSDISELPGNIVNYDEIVDDLE